MYVPTLERVPIKKSVLWAKDKRGDGGAGGDGERANEVRQRAGSRRADRIKDNDGKLSILI